MQKMGMYLFGDCKKLKKISIEKIKTIPMYSLALVTGLQKLTLGKDVEKIEASAVHHCPNLRTVSFKTQNRLIGHMILWAEQKEICSLVVLSFVTCI